MLLDAVPIMAKSPSTTMTMNIAFTTDAVTCRPSDSADPFTASPSIEAISPITKAMKGALIRPTAKCFQVMTDCRRARKVSTPMPP